MTDHYYHRFAKALCRICGEDNLTKCIDRLELCNKRVDEICLGGDDGHCLCGKEIEYPSYWILDTGGYVVVGSVCIEHFADLPTNSSLIRRTLDNVNNIKRKAQGLSRNGKCSICLKGRTSHREEYNNQEYFMHVKCARPLLAEIKVLAKIIKTGGVTIHTTGDPVADLFAMHECSGWEHTLDAFYIAITHEDGPIYEVRNWCITSDRDGLEWYEAIALKMEDVMCILDKLYGLQSRLYDSECKFITDLYGQKDTLVWTPKRLRWLYKINRWH